MRKEKLWDICMEIYRELYKKAEPSADFDKLMETHKNEPFFDKYYLDQAVQSKIIEDTMKKYSLKKYEKQKIRNEIYLGASPVGFKKE